MDTATLYTFLTVARLGSFTEAAETMYLSQSAVSKRIAALESELNSRLLDRIGKQVLLTEAGKILATRTQRLLAEIEDTRREIQNLAQNVSGKLCIGTSHHIGLHRLPSVLQTFTALYPDVELDLQFRNSEQICSAIKSGELELGVITLPLQPVEHLSVQFVWEDKLEFVAGRNHPLLKSIRANPLKGGSIPCSLNELAHYPAILPSRDTFTREIVDGLFARHQLALTTKMETNYLETIKMLVSVGLGWSVLPKTMLDETTLVLQLPDMAIGRRLGAAWHTSRTLSNAAKQFLSQLLL